LGKEPEQPQSVEQSDPAPEPEIPLGAVEEIKKIDEPDPYYDKPIRRKGPR
jgi:hypothetical protein